VEKLLKMIRKVSIEGPFVIKRDDTYFMFFSTWTCGNEAGLLKSKSPLGPWELASRESIFGTRKKGYRSELAISEGYTDLKFQDMDRTHNRILNHIKIEPNKL
jgi:xylan 1,4-beta-xylosidase